MKILSISLFLSVLIYFTSLAQDTAYIYFQNQHPNYAVKLDKHIDDPYKRNDYPYDGGRHYHIPIQKPGFVDRDLSFNFRSYTPDWMDYQFEYCLVDTAIMHAKDFKDREWFDKTKYIDILKTFSNAEVIYLIDENYIKNGKAYMVRVYFNHSAVE